MSDELKKTGDALSKWAKARPSGFFIGPSSGFGAATAAVSNWVQTQTYSPAAVSEFFGDADYWLIAQALENRYTVVPPKRTNVPWKPVTSLRLSPRTVSSCGRLMPVAVDSNGVELNSPGRRENAFDSQNLESWESFRGMNVDDESGFRFLLEKVRRNRGIDFSQYRPSVVERRVAYRLHLTGCRTYWDYVLLLNRDPAEYDRLVEALSIKLSKFFRDPEVFTLLDEIVIPEVIASKCTTGIRTIRAWSCGTAFGQEAYSIAILLCESLGRRLGRFAPRIVATDIDESALESAKWGSYTKDALRAMRADLLFKYFTLVGDRYVVNDRLRSLITFKQHNVMTDSPETGMDLVLCRNVLIYFEADLQRRVLEHLYKALSPGGFLILGKVESMPSDILSRFDVVDLKQRVYRRAER